MFNALSSMMLSVLQFFYGLCGNYGLAIILLTITVKVALYPLTLQSSKQMEAMQKVQPKVKEIQAKFKDKPDQLQKEMVALYKTEGVNPLGGCLPMLLQLPFFISLFWALTGKEFAALTSATGANASMLWITNLAKPDPWHVMVFLIGVTTYLSQKTMPGATGNQQKGMLYFMPAFIAFISINFPAGVQIYWVVSNAIATLQQVYIARARK